MQTRTQVLWRVAGWKGFSVVACGHLHARPDTMLLTDFHCWCERPLFDMSHDVPLGPQREAQGPDTPPEVSNAVAL